MSTPVFRCRPSIWKMSVSEKTLSVPSRPTGDPPADHLRADPDEGRPAPRRRSPSPAAPPAGGSVSGSKSFSSTSAAARPEEEEEERDRARDRRAPRGTRAIPAGAARRSGSRAPGASTRPCICAGLGHLDLDVHVLLAQEGARAHRAVQGRVAVAPAAVAEGAAAALAQRGQAPPAAPAREQDAQRAARRSARRAHGEISARQGMAAVPWPGRRRLLGWAFQSAIRARARESG